MIFLLMLVGGYPLLMLVGGYLLLILVLD